ncbi:MAG: YpdA family putative bacillithiol disulfide reductase [Saprospiraceae bacterium]|jgi:thioredoxin reductase (NADPH)|nr:YpdA family putative bacillithiol disulfide reductase [Saprospiraceae bacterium]
MFNLKAEKYDIVILGAGPIGMACGIEAKKTGLTYIIIDKGCLVNSIYHYPLNMTFFSTSEKLEIGRVPFISHQPKPNRQEALEYYRRVCTSWDLNVSLYNKATQITSSGSGHLVQSEKGSYQAGSIIMALGFYDLPYLLNIPGEKLPKVKHYYDEPHPYFGQHIVVIGAANSAVDVALETWRKGAFVTMVIREDEIRQSVKYWSRPDIINRIADGSIKAYFLSELTRITPKSVEINTPDGLVKLKNDFVMAMTGYQPPFEFMTSAGIKFNDDPDRTPVYDENTMESNVKNLYLAGVLCGGLKTNKWFIENSRVHAEMIIRDIFKKINAG